jgi:multidrug efflux pump subunit AcrB
MNRFFLTYKNPLSVAIVLIILGGMLAYSKLQTALFPEITFPKIKIIADAGEQPVDQMMLTVTRPLELAVKEDHPKRYKSRKLRDIGLYGLECRYRYWPTAH